MKCCILTEGGNEFGFGHIMRCSSFYDALLERGHEVEFVIQGDYSVNEILEERKVKFLKWHGNINRFINDYKNYDIVVLDSLHVNQEEINIFCNQSFFLVAIDDFLRNLYHDSLIIDWTINVEKTSAHLLNFKNRNIVLLGIDYLVLRKPFWNNSIRSISKLKKILITIGGSDIRELTFPLIKHLSTAFKDLKFDVIMGTSSDLNNLIISLNNGNIELYESISSLKMKMLMDQCDVAVSAGGQTLYELASVGLPTIAVEIIDNQKEDIKGWNSMGLLYRVVSWNDPLILEKISEALNELRSINIRESIYNNVKNLVKGDKIIWIIDLIENIINDKSRKQSI